jgi:hypothetical protein
MDFKDALERHSPNLDLYEESEFVKNTCEALAVHGFHAVNTIACAGLCRDEITQPFVTAIKEAWGESFNLSSLAGMFFAGKTGLAAAMHHAPNSGGRERYVFYSMPHVAIGEDGEVGACSRRGRDEKSTACGALNAFRKEMAAGRLDVVMNSADIEQSLLKMRLMREIPYGRVPDLLELTALTQKAALADLETAVEAVADPSKSDYAVISGIQVHGPDKNYVWRVSCYAIVEGRRHEVSLVSQACKAA